MLEPAMLPEDEASRRQFLTIAGGLVLLTACGETDQADPGPATRAVESAHGSIVIPSRPRRVVAMHDQLVAYAVASLGFEDFVGIAARDAEDPSAAIQPFGEIPAGFQRELTDIGTYAEPDVEAIATLEPDLIIGLPYEVDPIYDQLRQIAPTVVIKVPQGERPPFELQRTLADLVGVEGELDERLEDAQARLAAVRAAIGDRLVGVPYAAVETYGVAENYVTVSDYVPGLVVAEELGMVRSSTTANLEEYTETSLENIDEFDADVIFLMVPEGIEVDATMRRLLDTTTAGRAGQVFEVPRETWGLEVVEAKFQALDDLERIFADADVNVSGDFG